MFSHILLPCLLVLSLTPFEIHSISSHIFLNLIKQQSFVDKTDVLKVFFDHASIANSTNSSSPPSFFITNPRRFGKSSISDMIYWFASIEQDENGDPVSPNQTSSWETFKKLKIFNYPDIVSEHLGRYIVLHLDLMGVGITLNTADQAIRDVGTLLYYELQSFPRVKRLLESNQSAPNEYGISEADIRLLRNVENRNLTKNEGETSVFLVVKILSQLYKTKVILIFHQYDETAVNSYVVQKSYVGPVYDFINTVIYTALTFGRQFIKFAIIHSATTLGYAQSYELRDLVKHYPFLEDHEFTPYYAFTESEAEDLFDRFHCDEEEKQILRKQYGGYKTVNGTTYYGTFSLVTYLFQRARNGSRIDPPPSFVHKSMTFGRLAAFMTSPEFRNKIFDIYENGTMEYAIEKCSTLGAVRQLERLRDRRFQGVLPHHLPMLFTQCFEMGYFSHVPGTNHTYEIPNGEIKEMFKEEIQSYYNVYQNP